MKKIVFLLGLLCAAVTMKHSTAYRHHIALVDKMTPEDNEYSNRHAPVFVNAPYVVIIEGNEAIGVSLFQFEAMDEDEGISDSEINFKIVSGNLGDHFHVTSIQRGQGRAVGSVILVKQIKLDTSSIDGHEPEPTTYKLMIIAFNAKAINYDDPFFQAQTTLVIHVQEFVEYLEFLGLPYQTSICAETKYQLLDVQVLAADHDYWGQQRTTLSLPNKESWIKILKNGTLKTKDFIDRTNVKNGVYNLVVQASDQEGSVATANVSIAIIEKKRELDTYGEGWSVSMCDKRNKPSSKVIVRMAAYENNLLEDDTLVKISFQRESQFIIETVNETAAKVSTAKEHLERGTYSETVKIEYFSSKCSYSKRVVYETLIINVISCADEFPDEDKFGNLTFNDDIMILSLIAFVVVVLVVIAFRKKIINGIRSVSERCFQEEHGTEATNPQTTNEPTVSYIVT